MVDDTDILQIERAVLCGPTLPDKCKPGHIFFLLDLNDPTNTKIYASRQYNVWDQVFPPISGGDSITEITSDDGYTVITDGTGPIVNISIADTINQINETVDLLDPLRGVTDAIGGDPLLAGECTTAVIVINGAEIGMTIAITPETYPGDGVAWNAYISATDEVTVKVCAIVDITPVESIYRLSLFRS